MSTLSKGMATFGDVNSLAYSEGVLGPGGYIEGWTTNSGNRVITLEQLQLAFFRATVNNSDSYAPNQCVKYEDISFGGLNLQPGTISFSFVIHTESVISSISKNGLIYPSTPILSNIFTPSLLTIYLALKNYSGGLTLIGNSGGYTFQFNWNNTYNINCDYDANEPLYMSFYIVGSVNLSNYYGISPIYNDYAQSRNFTKSSWRVTSDPLDTLDFDQTTSVEGNRSFTLISTTNYVPFLHTNKLGIYVDLLFTV